MAGPAKLQIDSESAEGSSFAAPAGSAALPAEARQTDSKEGKQSDPLISEGLVLALFIVVYLLKATFFTKKKW